MAESLGPEKHQLAGLDDRERGFSRPIELESGAQGCRAVLRYERLLISTDTCPTQQEALNALILSLQGQGYRQLKTQMIFQSGVYLGSQRPWTEYPDPPAEPARRGWLARVTGWFSRSTVRVEHP
jgi:hypothetical protein